MGSGRFDPGAYATYSSTISRASVDDIYKSKSSHDVLHGAAKHLNPHGVRIRESRDSADNPASTAIIVGIDVTGSMGMLAETIAKQGLGTLFTEILARKPVSDPHLMFMAIGDANSDQAPLQVSQFEADNRIVDQLTDIYVEHGGGGNHFESYNLPWYFAALHTSIDCLEKRGKKGYLFTIGDEEAPGPLTADQIRKFIGDTPERALGNDELLTLVGRMYHVFHVIVEEGSHARAHPDRVRKSWTSVLGQRVIPLSDHTKLAEVIVSAISVNEGALADDVASSWSGETAVVVRKAVGSLATVDKPGTGGVVRL